MVFICFLVTPVHSIKLPKLSILQLHLPKDIISVPGVIMTPIYVWSSV
jgi:hypothetical protein